MSLALRAETGILLLGVPKRTSSSSVFGKKGPGSALQNWKLGLSE